MKADSRRELEGLVEDIRAVVVRLRGQDQPLATQLLEMAVIELRSRMHGISDEELQVLVDTLSGDGSPAAQTELPEIGELNGLPTRTSPPGRVVAFGEARRAKCKRRS
jgi:hypothetical protein